MVGPFTELGTKQTDEGYVDNSNREKQEKEKLKKLGQMHRTNTGKGRKRNTNAKELTYKLKWKKSNKLRIKNCGDF